MNKCKHCGKDVEKDAKVCPHCQKSLEDTANDGVIEAVKSAVKAEISPLSAKIDDVDKRLKVVEALPLRNMAVAGAGIIVPRTYRGYKVHEQGAELREKFSSRANWFKTLSKPENFDKFVEFMLDVKFALTGDLKAMQKLQEAREKASDLAEGTDSLGGYLVPVEHQMDLIRLAREKSFAMQLCRVVTMGKNTQNWPSEATLVDVTWEDEAGSIDEQNPTWGQVQLVTKKCAGMTSGISNELLADSDVDIVGELTEQFMYAIGLSVDNQVLNGTGSPCSGVLSAAVSNVVTLAGNHASSITADKLSEAIYTLSEEDANAATFIYSRLVQHYIRILKDTYGQYIWQRPGEGRPGTIWELPYRESTKAPAGTASNTAFGILGNWKLFMIGLRNGTMTFAADPYGKFSTDQTRFRVTQRMALKIARASAFVKIKTNSV